MPFLNETRTTLKFKIIKKTDSELVVEVETTTMDTPYSDTFLVREIWVAMADPENADFTVLKHFMKIDFVKYSFFKSQV